MALRLLIMLAATPAMAFDYYFDASSDPSWSNPDNWTPLVPPTTPATDPEPASTTVILNGGDLTNQRSSLTDLINQPIDYTINELKTDEGLRDDITLDGGQLTVLSAIHHDSDKRLTFNNDLNLGNRVVDLFAAGDVSIGDGAGPSGSLSGSATSELRITRAHSVDGGDPITVQLNRPIGASFNGDLSFNGVNFVTQGGGGMLGDRTMVSLLNGGEFFVNGAETIGGLSGEMDTKVHLNEGLEVGGDDEDAVYSGTLHGSQPFSKVGIGTQVLTGSSASTFTGDLFVKEGVLEIAENANLSTDTRAVLSSGATFLLDKAETMGGLSGEGGLSVLNQTLRVFLKSADVETYHGEITGAGGFVKFGKGWQSLAGGGDFQGSTAIWQGTLEIAPGAHFSGSREGRIDSARFIVRGVWSSTGDLYLGLPANSSSDLVIEDGGVVTNTFGRIGVARSARGRARVSNGAWHNSSILFVGSNGDGELIVDAGGLVTSASGIVGTDSGSSGEARVQDGGIWRSTGDLTVGRDSDDATLEVTTQGAVESRDGLIGSRSNSNGSVQITGSGSWLVSRSLYVGGNADAPGGEGLLSIGRGGLVTVGQSLTVWGEGAVGLGDGSLKSPNIDHTHGGEFIFADGNLQVGSFQGDLRQEGGQLELIEGDSVLSLSGDYRFDAGVLELVAMQSGPATLSLDLVEVTGDLTLDGGALSLLTSGSIETDLLFGQTLEILDVDGTVAGEFDGLPQGALVGTFSGVSLYIDYTGGDGNDITLVGALPGDFNEDGAVDAADYTVWRDTVGQPAGTLPNDLSGEAIGQTQYDAWAVNYGAVAPGLSAIGVPEPSCLALVSGWLALAACYRRS